MNNNMLQSQPVIEYKVGNVYPDGIRQHVVSKMFTYLQGKGMDGYGLGYRFSKAEYDMLLTDEYTHQRICSNG